MTGSKYSAHSQNLGTATKNTPNGTSAYCCTVITESRT